MSFPRKTKRSPSSRKVKKGRSGGALRKLRGRRSVCCSDGVYVRFKTLAGFRLGQRVTATLDSTVASGVVSFIGCVHFTHGVFIGVSLESPVGIHNGEMLGVKYFRTAANCGVLVRPSNVQPLSPQLSPVVKDDAGDSLEDDDSDNDSIGFPLIDASSIAPSLLKMEERLKEVQCEARQVLAANRQLETELQTEECRMEDSKRRISELEQRIAHSDEARSRRQREEETRRRDEERVQKLEKQFAEMRQTIAQKQKQVSKWKNERRASEKERKQAMERKDAMEKLNNHGAMSKDTIIAMLSKSIAKVRKQREEIGQKTRRLMDGSEQLDSGSLLTGTCFPMTT